MSFFTWLSQQLSSEQRPQQKQSRPQLELLEDRVTPTGGNFAFAEGFGGSGADEGYEIAVDNDGNVYTTGYFEGTADFDPSTGTANLTSNGGRDVFVSKLDSSGNFLWARQLGGSSNDFGFGIAVDGSGRVYTTGYFEGTADFDPSTGTANLTSNGSFDVFVSKLDSSGNFLWARQLGGSSDDIGRGIAIDGSGSVYTTGYFQGTADFDPSTGTANLTSNGGRDVFVSKLDSSGNFLWARQLGGSSSDIGFGIAVNGSGSVYTTGAFQGTADFGPGTIPGVLTSNGNRDAFVLKLQDGTLSSGLSAGNLVISDVDSVGKNNQLSLSRSGNLLTITAANEQFSSAPPGGTLSTDKQTLTFDLSTTTINTLTINAAGGDDVIDVNSLGTGFASLTINGQSGSDTVNFNNAVTFASNNSLSVNADTINLTNSNSDLSVSGTGTASLVADRNISLASSSSITTVDGDITLAANTAGAASGNFRGIELNAASISSMASGNISLTGQGGDQGLANIGIHLRVQSAIESTGTGAVTLVGTGGAGDGFDYGVLLDQSSVVRSAKGDVALTGNGGSGGDENYGVYLADDSRVESTGSGLDAANISIDGTAGNGATLNHGVRIGFNNAAGVSTVDGDVTIIGQGAGTNNFNYGVSIEEGGQVESTGSGAIAIDGTAGNGTDNNFGVRIGDAGSQVTSTDGNITITGTGQGSTFENYGVYLSAGGQVTSTGVAAITIDGTGGDGTDRNRGVRISSSGSKVSSVVGDITITGTAGNGSGRDSNGVLINNGASIESTSATITVDGTGGSNGTDANHGVQLFGSGSEIRSVNGNIAVSGQGGDGSGFNAGVVLNSGGQLVSTGNANISVTGTGGGIGSSNHGVFLVVAGSGISTVDGDINITGTGGGTLNTNQGVWIATGTEVTSTGSGAIVIDGTSGNGVQENQGVLLNGGTIRTTASGDISVTGQANGSQDFNEGIRIASSIVESTGTGSNAGSISIVGMGGDGTDRNRGVRIFSSGSKVSSVVGDISITGTAGNGSGRDNNGVLINDGASIESTSATIAVDGTGGSNGTDVNHGVQLFGSGSEIRSVNGNITVSGQGGDGSGFNAGVVLNSGGQLVSTGNANISVTGTGGGIGSSNHGVFLVVAGSGISTVDGDINITGTGGGTVNTNQGVWLATGTEVTSTGSGAIVIDGTSGNGVQENQGVLLSGGTIRTTASGDISVTGQANGSQDFNEGIRIASSIVESTGTGSNAGSISIVGTGGNGTNSNHGVSVVSNGALTASGGDISVTGQGGNGSANSNHGVFVQSSSLISTDGEVNLNGTSGSGISDDIRVEASPISSATATGDVLLTGGSDFNVALNGIAAGVFDQLAVTGAVDLSDVDLNVSLGFTPTLGDSFVIIQNDGTDPVTGTFAGLPEQSFFEINGTPFVLTYQGGDGNDVVLVVNTLSPPRANVGGPYAITDADSLTLDGSGSSDPDGFADIVSFEWDIAGDGAFDDAFGVTPTVPQTALVSLGLGAHTIGLRVTDQFGARHVAITRVTIVDDDPEGPSIDLMVLPNQNASDAEDNLASWTIGDASGVAGRTVRVRDGSGAVVFENSTDDTGTFDLNGLAPGNYTFEADGIDADNDRPGDESVAGDSIGFTITDDDVEAPIITLGGSQGTEFVTDDNRFTWDVQDASQPLIVQVTITRDGATLATFNTPVGEFDLNPHGIGQFEISVAATDGDDDRPDDSLSASASRSVEVVNRPPVADAGGPYTIDEGAGVTLDASASTDPDDNIVGYAWDLDNDGAFDDATGVAPSLTWNDLVALGINDDGAYAISVRVQDAFNATHVASSTLTVSNVAPTLTVSIVTPIDEGSSTTLSGSVLDPSFNDTFTLNLDWGDSDSPNNIQSFALGSTVLTQTNDGIEWNPSTRQFEVNHQYLDNKPTIVVQAVLTDDDAVVAAAPITDGRVAYFPADGTPEDLSLQGHDGTLQGGAAFADGILGQAFSLDGIDDWVSSNQSFGDDQSHTIATWVNWDGHNHQAHQEIVSWWNLADPAFNRMFLGTSQAGGQGPLRNGDGWQSVPATLPPGEWVHVAATYDGSTNTREVFLNGVSVGTLPNSDEARFSGLLAIGRQGNEVTADEYWDGRIDELALYDRILGTAELQSLVATGFEGDLATVKLTVNNVAPSVDADHATIPVAEGQTAANTGVFADPGADTVALSASVGSITDTGSDTWAWSFDTNDGPDQTQTVTITATDSDGATTSTTFDLVVNNVAPTPTIDGAPATSAEGTSINLTSSVSDPSSSDTHTYAWSATKDGNTFATGSGTAFSFTPDDNGSYVVTLTVTDDDGDVGTDAKTIAVTNVNPTATINGAPATSAEGTQIGLTSSFADPGSADTHTLAWSVSKDGNAFATGSGASFSFTPDDNGSYVVTLTVTDDDGGVGTDSKTINGTNVAPNATINGAPSTSAEGTQIDLTGSFTDPGSADTHTLAWSVTKDGDVYATGSGSSFSFTPDDNGSYIVTLTATDDDGGVGTDSKTISVTNVNPTATINGAPATSAEGTQIDLTATFTDPGSADTHTLAWAVTKDGNAFATGSGSSFSFTPDDDGSYVVTLTVTDDDGGVDTDANTIAVTNVAPTASINGAPVTSAEGTQIDLTGTFTDPGSADTHTLAWSVTKDGNAFATGSGSAFSFTPDDNGSYVVTLTVTDDDGGVGTDAKTINVTNVAPNATINGAPATSPEGTRIDLTGSFTDLGSADTHSLAWSVTKDGNAFATGSGASFSFTPDDNGSYVVTLTATDDDGGVGTDTKTITVTNVAPVVTISGPNQADAGSVVTFTLTTTDAAADLAAGFTFAIDWDGDDIIDQTVTGPSGTQVQHTFADDGGFDIVVTATDKDGDTSLPAEHFIQIGSAPGDPGTAVMVGDDLVITGTDDDDVIRVRKRPSTGEIYVRTNGHRFGPFTPTGKVIANGLEGNDDILVSRRIYLPAELFGDEGNDRLRGGSGDDLLEGGAGNDLLIGKWGNDILEGGADNDELRSGLGNDILRGGADNDLLRGSQGNDRLEGGDGNDILRGGSDDDILDGGAGDDELRGFHGDDILIGGPGNDLLLGGAGDDELDGGDGHDRLSGGIGDDLLRGGAGNDYLLGKQGDDILLGEAGDDIISGGSGHDIALGGEGDDELTGGQGRDLLIGGHGSDDIEGKAQDDILIAALTTFDTDLVALGVIRDEWTSNRSYQQRVANLKGTGCGPSNNGNVFLIVDGPNATVHEDHATDVLRGGSGTDWFFANLDQGVLDVLKDQRRREENSDPYWSE